MSAGVIGLLSFSLLLFGTSTSYMSRFDLGSSRFQTVNVQYVAGVWARRFEDDDFYEDDEHYCKHGSANSTCTAVRTMRAAAVLAVLLSCAAFIVVLLVEQLEVGARRVVIGKGVAVALFVFAGFWSMIVFFIWRSSVQGNIEQYLEEDARHSFDDIDVRVGYSQVLVVLGWLFSWVGAFTSMSIPTNPTTPKSIRSVKPQEAKVAMSKTAVAPEETSS